MNEATISDVFAALEEELAALEHERWAHWQRYVHQQAEARPDGSLVIPVELAERWARQIATPYADLSEAEKESDRQQVRRYFPLIEAAMQKVIGPSSV